MHYAKVCVAALSIFPREPKFVSNRTQGGMRVIPLTVNWLKPCQRIRELPKSVRHVLRRLSIL